MFHIVSTPNFTPEYLSFEISVQNVLFLDLTSEACHVVWWFPDIVLQVKLILFPSIW
jgi:hypothetical protein